MAGARNLPPEGCFSLMDAGPDVRTAVRWVEPKKELLPR
jgi:hypothetical protein